MDLPSPTTCRPGSRDLHKVGAEGLCGHPKSYFMQVLVGTGYESLPMAGPVLVVRSAYADSWWFSPGGTTR